MSIEHFWRFVIVSPETDLVVLTFQLLLDCETVTFFFLFFCVYFFYRILLFLLYFLDVFFDSLPSLTRSLPPPAPPPAAPHLLQTRENDRFVPLQTICSNIPRSWLSKKYGLLCGLKDFALIDVLVSWKL